ncbi:MAG: succinate dehydrogenase iron-sulfur subunit [Planctomycetes bacterium]|nr:succinate dehydrogenase iron-sulfur subunit [Planctomycetota bacterium]
MDQTVILSIKRQDAPGASPRWEQFSVPLRQNMNVISALQEVQRNPVTTNGERVAPVAWECSCLEEVCGACTMVIAGRVRQACSTLLSNLDLTQPVSIEPMRKFPVERDLCVDRSKMFESLKRVRAWVDIDGTHDLGPGPRMAPEDQQRAYLFARCMTCGCCLDACPNVNEGSDFIGAAPLGQAFLFNMHPTGKYKKSVRLAALMGDGGISGCGNAQNCVEVCPKEIPLTDAIAALGWDTNVQAVKNVLTFVSHGSHSSGPGG